MSKTAIIGQNLPWISLKPQLGLKQILEIILKGEKLETVKETRLLGTIISDDLKWRRNTEYLAKKANQRMKMLHIASKFTSKYSDLKTIYKLFIRSILEQSAVFWHNSLKKFLQIYRLSERRMKLCVNFAKKSLRNEKAGKLFPMKQSKKCLGSSEIYKVNFANTDRYQKSTIPFLQNLLNKKENDKADFKRACGFR